MTMRKRPGSLYARLFWAFALVTAIAVALPAVFSRNALYQDRISLAGEQALAQAAFARGMLESGPTEAQVRDLFAAAKALAFRMTLTDAAGTVLRDSHIGEDGVSRLDNHGDRPEIEAARAVGSGISLRHGNSLGIDAVYAAVAMRNGGVLRVAVPLAVIEKSLRREIMVLAGTVAGAAALCLLLAAIITRNVRRRMDGMAEVVADIARDKGGRRLRDIRWKEMEPLARAVNHMADTIEEYVRTTTDQQGQLETILDSMHEGVLVLGPTGTVRRWNRALAALFPDIAGAAGRAVIEGIPLPALQQRVTALLEGRRDGEGPGPEAAIPFEMPAGRFLVAHVSGPASRNESLGAVIVVYDATEIMRLEGARRDFVSNVSHELRTPLTAITGYAETLMTADDLDGEYRRFAGIIHKHAASLARIISDLLALARIENARETIALAPVEPGLAVKEAVAATRGQAEARGVAISLDLEPGLVSGNGALLAQVFRNLLENACRYSPEGGTVRVSSRREGGLVLFAVADDGPGIPRAELSRIFERFYQVKKERNSGTAGIGLAICKHIIERHGGRIWAESPYGSAATAMLFTLPAASRAASA